MWAPETRNRPGGVRFDLYGQAPIDLLNYTRSIAAIHDEGWAWEAY